MDDARERYGIVQVKVPLPFPLRWVNAYLLTGGEEGITLIDPGLHTEEAETVWLDTMEREGIRWPDIGRIVLTHHHPDHYGLAGWFQERTGAPVLLSADGARLAKRLWGAERELSAAIRRLFARHGMDESMLAALDVHNESFIPQVSPQPNVALLEAGSELRMGGRTWETVDTPGHASGHLCFYDRGRRVMICGDHVLPRISPNISLMPGEDGNPLSSYLDSLARIGEYEVEAAFPGHREPFTEFAFRAGELIEHHAERLEFMRGKLAEQSTAYQLCLHVFGNRLTIHQLRFALAETIAHLVYLRETGRVSETENEGLLYYRALPRASGFGSFG